MASPQKEHGYTAIANEIMEAFGKIRIPGEARQMLDVIIRKTYGYNKKHDCIATSQFCEMTGLSRGMIHRARRKLLCANLITVCKNAHSNILSYSFQKDYHKWIPYAKKHTVCKKVIGGMQKGTQSVSNKEAHNNNKVDIQKKEVLFPFLKDEFFKTTYMAYLEMRNKIKKPTTDHAEMLILKKLHKYEIKIAIQMLENSITGAWQGIFELKGQPQGGTQWKKP